MPQSRSWCSPRSLPPWRSWPVTVATSGSFGRFSPGGGDELASSVTSWRTNNPVAPTWCGRVLPFFLAISGPPDSRVFDSSLAKDVGSSERQRGARAIWQGRRSTRRQSQRTRSTVVLPGPTRARCRRLRRGILDSDSRLRMRDSTRSGSSKSLLFRTTTIEIREGRAPYRALPLSLR